MLWPEFCFQLCFVSRKCCATGIHCQICQSSRLNKSAVETDNSDCYWFRSKTTQLHGTHLHLFHSMFQPSYLLEQNATLSRINRKENRGAEYWVCAMHEKKVEIKRKFRGVPEMSASVFLAFKELTILLTRIASKTLLLLDFSLLAVFATCIAIKM